MTELENVIYKCALDKLSEARKAIRKTKTETRYVEIPFCCEGCIDGLTYDKELKKFIIISYSKGIRKRSRFGGLSRYSAYFDYDDIKLFKIDITNDRNFNSVTHEAGD